MHRLTIATIVGFLLWSSLMSFSYATNETQSSAILNRYITDETETYIRIPAPMIEKPTPKKEESTFKKGWRGIKGMMGDVADRGGELTDQLMESRAGSYLQYLNPNEYVDLERTKEIARSLELKEFLHLERLKGTLGLDGLKNQIEQFDLNELLGLRIMGLSVGEFLILRKETIAPVEIGAFGDHYLMTTQFNFHDYRAFNQLVEKVLHLDKMYFINKKGFGNGENSEYQYFYHFDQLTGRFFLVMADIEREDLSTHLFNYWEEASLTQSTETFINLERYAEESQRDWLIWISTQSKGESLGELNRFLIRLFGFSLQQIKDHNIRSLTLGRLQDSLGSHLTLLIESPMNRYLNYPTINPEAYRFTIADRPIQIRIFSLPTADMIQDDEDGLMGEKMGRYFNQLREAVLEGYNIDITHLFTIFGPEGATYRQRNGALLALKLKDKQGYEQLLETLDRDALKHQILDEDIYQYILENKLKDLLDHYLAQYQAYAEENGGTAHQFMANKGIPWLLKRSGLYRDIQLNFQQQGEWVFISVYPNPLLERSRSTIYLNQWLHYQTHFSDESVYGMIYNLNEADLQRNRYYHRFIDLIGESFDMPLSALRLRDNAQIELAVYLQPNFMGATATYNLSRHDLLYLIVNYNIAYLFWIPKLVVNLYDYYHAALYEMNEADEVR